MESAHPMVVHFPVALLMAAFLIESLALAFRRPGWHRIALWNLVLGTLGAAAAVLTGRIAGETAKHSWEIHQVMELHERLGYAVLSLAAGVTGLRLLSRDRLAPHLWRIIRVPYLRKHLPLCGRCLSAKGAGLGRIGRWVSWWALGLVVAGMAYGAHLGGRLVYEFGVGGSHGRGSGIEVVR